MPRGNDQSAALLEGAFILCRSTRSTEALEAAGKAAVVLVESAIRGCDSPAIE
jgi:hypothetical protein